ncbi:MAG TPA: RDD family protein [Streptosporangiaceae bacterium]|nr:RDD family protein [Streptosporangiaceae bacterium]
MSEVVTGEAVVLELPVATFPGRLLALAIDVVAQAALGILALIAISSMLDRLNGDYIAAIVVSTELAITVVYATAWETMTRGKTPGKMALGLRVVGDDGSPERFRQALVRSLVGLIEIYSFPPIALIASIASAKGKRLGDIFAGTYVLQERMPARAALSPVFAVVPPPLLGWAQSLQLSALSDQTADAASSYLRRFAELSPAARESLGFQIANAVAAEVSPPPPAGTPPPAYLAAVLAVRRQRDAAGTAAAGAVLPPQFAPPPPPPPPQSAPAIPAVPVPPPLVPPGLVPPAAPLPQPSEPGQPSPPAQAPLQTAPPLPAPDAPPTQPTAGAAPGFAPPA